MRAAHTRTVFILVFSAAAMAGVIVIARQAARLTADARQHAGDAAEIEQLRAALRTRPVENARPAEPPQPAPAPAHIRSGAPEAAKLAAAEATIERQQRELAEARAGIASLQRQLASALQDKQAAVADAGDKLQKREQEWRARLDDVEGELKAARAEAEQARSRREEAARPAETRAADAGAGVQAAELRQTVSRLEELDRRRDAYLASILRRYRDITEQFRAMRSGIDASRGSGPAAFADIALGRIQNATAQTEDDLRRLNELNAQARQLETRLAKNGP